MRQRRTSSRWDAAKARSVLAEQEASGLTVEAYARERGLVSQRLRWWSKRLGGGTGAGALLPVRVVDDVALAAAPTVVEVVLRSGHVLRMTGGDAGALRSLVAALEGSC